MKTSGLLPEECKAELAFELKVMQRAQVNAVEAGIDPLIFRERAKLLEWVLNDMEG